MNETIPGMFLRIADRHPGIAAQLYRDAAGSIRSVTYGALLQEVRSAAAGFIDFGVTRGEVVGFISDNRH